MGITINKTLRLAQRNFLTASDQMTYDALLKALENFSNECIVISYCLKIQDALIYDHPELTLYWDYPQTRFDFYRGKPLKLHYLHNPKASLKRLDAFENEAFRIFTEILRPNMNDKEQLRAVYHYITTHFTYVKDMPNNESFTLDTLMNKKGVCQGLAMTLIYLLHYLQIDIMGVFGSIKNGQEDHGWNCYCNRFWNLLPGLCKRR